MLSPFFLVLWIAEERLPSLHGMLTFSLSDTVVDGDVLLFLPLSSRQRAGVVCGCIAVKLFVFGENVRTILVGRFGQQIPVQREKFTVEGG